MRHGFAQPGGGRRSMSTWLPQRIDHLGEELVAAARQRDVVAAAHEPDAASRRAPIGASRTASSCGGTAVPRRVLRRVAHRQRPSRVVRRCAVARWRERAGARRRGAGGRRPRRRAARSSPRAAPRAAGWVGSVGTTRPRGERITQGRAARRAALTPATRAGTRKRAPGAILMADRSSLTPHRSLTFSCDVGVRSQLEHCAGAAVVHRRGRGSAAGARRRSSALADRFHPRRGCRRLPPARRSRRRVVAEALSCRRRRRRRRAPTPARDDRRGRSRQDPRARDFCLDGTPDNCKRWAMDGFYRAIEQTRTGTLGRALRVSWYGDWHRDRRRPRRFRARMQAESATAAPPCSLRRRTGSAATRRSRRRRQLGRARDLDQPDPRRAVMAGRRRPNRRRPASIARRRHRIADELYYLSQPCGAPPRSPPTASRRSGRHAQREQAAGLCRRTIDGGARARHHHVGQGPAVRHDAREPQGRGRQLRRGQRQRQELRRQQARSTRKVMAHRGADLR